MTDVEIKNFKILYEKYGYGVIRGLLDKLKDDETQVEMDSLAALRENNG